MGGTAVTWRGVRLDRRTRAMMREVARLTPDMPTITPTQGSYSTSVSASAGTHSGGGAIDISAANLSDSDEYELVRIMRRVGFAAWLRRPWQGPWPEHIHAIAIGCDDLSTAARHQVEAYRNGRNGLTSNGPDAGPDVPVMTWERYQEENKMTPKQLWRYRGIDYVNDKPTTKDHQQSRAHQYSLQARDGLLKAGAVAAPGTEEEPRPTSGDGSRRDSIRYAIQRIWRWVYWTFRRVKRIEARQEQQNAKLDAILAASRSLVDGAVRNQVDAALQQGIVRVDMVRLDELAADDDLDGAPERDADADDADE